jgi:hypothetical protein
MHSAVCSLVEMERWLISVKEFFRFALKRISFQKP